MTPRAAAIFCFAIRTNALLEEGIDTWLFECKSYTAGIGRGTISKMNQLFAMAYMESPRDHGIKVSVVVNHVAMIEQCLRYKMGDEDIDFKMWNLYVARKAGAPCNPRSCKWP